MMMRTKQARILDHRMRLATKVITKFKSLNKTGYPEHDATAKGSLAEKASPADIRTSTNAKFNDFDKHVTKEPTLRTDGRIHPLF